MGCYGHDYRPMTEGGKKLARLQLAEDICQHLFSSKDENMMDELDEACDQLELAMGTMLQVKWGSSFQEQE